MICPYMPYIQLPQVDSPGAIACCSMFSWVQKCIKWINMNQYGWCDSNLLLWVFIGSFHSIHPFQLFFLCFCCVFLMRLQCFDLPCASNDDELIFLVGGRASCRYAIHNMFQRLRFFTPGCRLQFLGKSMNLFNFGVRISDMRPDYIIWISSIYHSWWNECF